MQLGILYLDDSEIALEAVKEGLERLGIDVTTHRNPLTIYAALRAKQPSLLLVDANMPTLDGRTICTLVKKHMPKLPIVLFSSLAPADLKAMVEQCGADGYIEKSGNYTRIAADIRRVIVRHNAES